MRPSVGGGMGPAGETPCECLVLSCRVGTAREVEFSHFICVNAAITAQYVLLWLIYVVRIFPD